jgi:7,8-dihydropterin-6-yl-methyl-4-(beta-D-ribofuranosyl)aminobenzene 5'-phosphate synthase
MSESVALAPVDGLEVTVVMDNSIDLLTPSTETAVRSPFPATFAEGDQLRAEHGYSLSISVTRGGHTDKILYDAGLSKDSTMHNLDVLGLDPKDYRAVVLSHGHADHHGGLEGLFGRVRGSMPLIVHPHAWRERKIVFPTGTETRLPPPSHNDLDREGWQVVEELGPSVLLGGSVLVTGQIDRVTEFEKGFPIQQALSDEGHWEPDTWTWDDQAIVVNVRGKGLVVLSSCSHSGVINVLHHARKVTGVDHIHGFIGGLHLSGGLFESITPSTIQGFVDMQPDLVVPGHCTGWKAIQTLGQVMPDAYVPSNVGTTFTFHALEPTG